MTVAELIEKLKEFPPEKEVKTYDYYWQESIDITVVSHNYDGTHIYIGD